MVYQRRRPRTDDDRIAQPLLNYFLKGFHEIIEAIILE
jgi:hypothetical protein